MRLFISSLQQAVALAILVLGSASAVASPLPYAHEASPDIYQVLLENDQVLVLKMVLEPGQSDVLHRHRAETVYFQRGGTLAIQPFADDQPGETINASVPDGHVMWHDAWAHRVTNTGNRPVTAIIVEQKD